jgi:hypothetical protein
MGLAPLPPFLSPPREGCSEDAFTPPSSGGGTHPQPIAGRYSTLERFIMHPNEKGKEVQLACIHAPSCPVVNRTSLLG